MRPGVAGGASRLLSRMTAFHHLGDAMHACHLDPECEILPEFLGFINVKTMKKDCGLGITGKPCSEQRGQCLNTRLPVQPSVTQSGWIATNTCDLR